MTPFPEGWWRKTPLIIGHRGASKQAPENTLAAFRAASVAGADGIELDVHLTADGVPVVMHNPRVDATTNGHGLINDLTLSQVKGLDAGTHFSIGFRGERVPTLEEVLSEVGTQLLVNIELKPQVRGNVDLEQAVADVVERLGLAERVWVSSFKPYALFRMHQIAPMIPGGLLYSPLSLGTVWLAPATPFAAFHPHVSLAPQWFVWFAHQLGYRVVVWTVDDLSRARQLIQWGVDAVITNDPASLIGLLG